MKASRRGPALRRLLDLCDDLQRIRTRLAEPDLHREARSRLRRQVRSKWDRLARDLASYRFKGPLGELLREFDLKPIHFQLLAVLLQRHLRSDAPAIEGRALLAAVFDNSFDVLSGMALLQDDSVLRTSGLVVLEQDDECTDDLLAARFCISDEALLAFRDEIAGLVVDDQRLRNARYSSNHEYLIDLRILHNLYKHRSDRVSHNDRWDRIRAGIHSPARHVQRRIESYWRKIDERLARTPESDQFPAVRFVREHQLTPEEVIVVVHLLFKELYEGNAYADAAELLRLVSVDELDLVRNRRLFRPAGTLLRTEMLQLEPMLEGRELTGEVYLSDWAVNYLFGATVEPRHIDPDERLDWHLYLKKLDDTQTFFRDLEAN